MTKTERDDHALPPLRVDHVADFYRRYPGDLVTFYTRIGVQQPVTGLTLQVSLPAGLILGDYQAPPELGAPLPVVAFDDGRRHLIWNVAGELPAGTSWEYRVQAQVAPTKHDLTLESRALVSVQGGDREAEERVAVAVLAKGRYLNHLPALYQADELMGRFLMLFESFWGPIEEQIDNEALYFDPRMAPPDFLPWLASWLNLVLDGRLPEERQRRLIQAAVSLYRRRGSKQGLIDYLEIYTGGKADVVEHRAKDFRLGPEARLGPGIALGKGNQPHAFTVTLHLPPVASPAGDEKDEDERARQEADLRRTIEAIIEAEKPAHTVYTLRIEAPPGDAGAPAGEAQAPAAKPKPMRQKGKGR
jgi:phage tail-like protein